MCSKPSHQPSDRVVPVAGRAVALLLAGMLAALAPGCVRDQSYPNRPITLVCPWAAGGGTDRVSRQVAMHLEQELGVPVNVINATGGKGVTGHRRGLKARPDGYTIAMTTLELNTMHWSGLTSLTYQDCLPLMSLNEDYAALFVRNDAPWRTVSELEAEIRRRPGELAASGTALGGAWHLALAGWLIAAEIDPNDVKWISETGAEPSIQQLMSGGVDLVCCSLPEARSFYESNEVRALGVMAPERATGFDEVATFREQGRDWSLGGWRGLAVPPGTDPEITRVLSRALDRIVRGESKMISGRNSSDSQTHEQTFPQFMQKQGFNNTWRPADEFARFMAETDEKFGRLLNSPAMKSVNQQPFHPLTFPAILASLLALSVLGLVLQRRLHPADSAAANQGTPRRRGVLNFAVLVASIAVYALLAETVGFVLLAGLLLVVNLWVLGTRWWLSVLIALALVPLTGYLFTVVLRVPLPRGWLGW